MNFFVVKPPSCGKDPYEPWEMTSRERDVSNKYLKLITYHVQRYYNYFRMFFVMYYVVHLRFGKLDIHKYKVIVQILTVIVDVIYDLLIVVPILQFSNNLTVIIFCKFYYSSVPNKIGGNLILFRKLV